MHPFPRVDGDRPSWHLLPTERVLLRFGPTVGVRRDVGWRLVPVLAVACAVVCAAFGGLLVIASLPGTVAVFSTGLFLALFAVAVLLGPSMLVDPCEYMVTDRRVHWRRGRVHRSMDRAGVTFARIRWLRGAPGVGHVDLVRAVPFGPFRRRQCLELKCVREPEVVLATIRGASLREEPHDGALPLVDRLDAGEVVLWGAHPVGLGLGWRDWLTALAGAAVLGLGGYSVYTEWSVLLDLEGFGLAVNSWAWLLLFIAIGTSSAVVLAVGGGLVWLGTVRPLRLARETEYVLTDRRVLIRRGATELSVDRRAVVDVAIRGESSRPQDMFLVLDAPGSRALADSGALGPVAPARDEVGPILFAVPDAEHVRGLIVGAVPMNAGTRR